uniref:Bm9302 n=1 Tax=Brugia malayi TaxID=6279 RepID=A0A1I9G153_BRUMA|nr:Bm9302 [Brugia malayi]
MYLVFSLLQCLSNSEVNRWFANRRRKQTKRRKVEIESPRSVTIPSLSSSIATTNKHNALTGLFESEQESNWASKLPLG